jgi:hypothetical protein
MRSQQFDRLRTGFRRKLIVRNERDDRMPCRIPAQRILREYDAKNEQSAKKPA